MIEDYSVNKILLNYPYKVTTNVYYSDYVFNGTPLHRWLKTNVGHPYVDWVSTVDYTDGKLVIAVKEAEHAVLLVLAWTD